MKVLNFLDNKRAIRQLNRVQKSVDKLLKSQPKQLSKRQHIKLKKLLNKRAKALSRATGMKIHSIFD